LSYPSQFISELERVCKPGGRILVVTWCHRVLEAGEKALRPDEQTLLDNICDAYYLPAWCSVADYATIADGLALKNIKVRWCYQASYGSTGLGLRVYGSTGV
jgi:tocopherol O-methyltransferase